MPVIAPALNIPLITEQLLKAITIKAKINMLNFFMSGIFYLHCNYQALGNYAALLPINN